MERTGPGPRIYVPLTMPDQASQPTYAVLEFVGFSSPANSSVSPHLRPSAIPSPSSAMLCLPPPPPPSSTPPSSFYPLSVPPLLHRLDTNPHNALITNPSHFPIAHFPEHNTLYLPSPSHLLAHHPRHPPPSRLDVFYLESPPSSPSSLAPSSASSSSKEKNPHSSTPPLSHACNPAGTTVVDPTGLTKPMASFFSSPSDAAPSLQACGSSRPMVPLNVAGDRNPCGLNKPEANFIAVDCAASGGLNKAMANFSSSCERDGMQTQISVSQNDRETIVHTHSSNFRDVVRQLTGASSDDQDLLPVTLPARLANRVNHASMVQNGSLSTEIGVPSGAGSGAGACTGGSKEQLGLRKPPLKLHERRKTSMKNLEKITTAFNYHAASELSPLNPSPVTPLASDFERFCNASTPTSQGSSGLSSPLNLIGKGRSIMEASNDRRGGEHQQDSGCFFMQCQPASVARTPLPPVEKASPTLLSLFPESPVCSPRDHR